VFAKSLGLTRSPLPFAVPDFTLSMIWHTRLDQDAGHAWFRELLSEIAAEI
jgi:LysR family transcriptional regulator, mexEF-oprN operon transcriptional activator